MEAFTEGRRPKTIPITMEKTTAPSIAGIDRATGVWDILDITSAITMPTTMPRIPPIRVSIADSVRNCSKMRFLRAPRAFLRPISLVRSVTETSMMFITPIPPTRRAMEATQISRRFVLEASSCLLRAFSRRSSAL